MPSQSVICLPEQMAEQIVNDMNSFGIGVAENCVPCDCLAELRQFVTGVIAANGGQYIALKGRDAVKGSLLQTLSDSADFMKFCREVYRRGVGAPAPDVPFYQVLRCLAGETGKNQSFYFHFDSYVLTILLPIIIPDEQPSGDLILVPNIRAIRRTYVRNLMDKIALDNVLSQRLLRLATSAGLLRPIRMHLVPGNAYFFWGYRTLHANEDCNPRSIRSTALFHLVNPHHDSSLRRALNRWE
jgi:hypothetical protein